ncbi:DUF1829 domain-containing protein [Rummeliibacillus suwonensis]|uniref:DUF1829 domain-containing protein n=1 Tax=Rummeliibacillus suwonensis TaxID=1306154 RepID=UPI0011B3702D|nr:DUF1829 domain-containing protein [Rummeliibacillus suwonensis]
MIEELKEIYNSWNNSNLKLLDKGEFIEITTPFFDIHHDFLQLVLIKGENNSFVLSDDGYTMNELEILGIDFNKSDKRQSFLNTTLNIFGVQIDTTTQELKIEFQRLEDYPAKQLNLLQCILRVSDMLMTSRNAVANIFFQEVEDYFKEQKILNTPNISFPGKSGNDNKFDFVIPAFGNKPERIIKAINKPTSENYKYPLLSFIDIKDFRADSSQIILANDLNAKISNKFITSFNNYDIQVLKWSLREEWIETINPLAIS